MKLITLIAVVCLSLQGAVPAFFVCADRRGHVEVETVEDGCCCGGEVSEHRAVGDGSAMLGPAGTTSDCGSCTDIVIQSHPTIRAERLDEGARVTPQGTLWPLRVLLHEEATTPASPESYVRAVPNDIGFLVSATTILLI